MKVLTKLAFAIKPYIQTVWFLIIFGTAILAQFFYRTPLTTFIAMTLILLLVVVNLLTIELTTTQRRWYYVFLVVYVGFVIFELVPLFV